MRPALKYKDLSKQKFIPLNISLRIFNFHRTKWLRLKKKIASFIKKKQKIVKKPEKKYRKNEIIWDKKKKFKQSRNCVIKKDFFENQNSKTLKELSKKFNCLKNKDIWNKKKIFYKTNIVRIPKQWFKLKRYYIRTLNLKRYYFHRFDNTISNRILKKNFKKEKNFALGFLSQKYLMLPYLKIDVLLWKVSFFISAFEMREFFHKKLIFLNFEEIKRNDLLLKNGDYISIKKKFSLRKQRNLIAIKPTLMLSKLISNFIDIEYFSNIVNILRSLEKFSNNKLFFILENKFFDIKFLKDYCLK